ncbi:MAG TPA: NAD(P)H-binding protein [Bryobacteraceae bacterium]|nr:NAD(P)H-binding protein [Bryobacteraceae bacterium]
MAIVLVTGGTGSLGREVVARSLAGRHRVRILTRQPKAPLSNAEVFSGSLADASIVRRAAIDADVIIHCASNSKDPQAADVEGTRALVESAEAVGSPHLIYISIVGVDRSTFPYYQAKHLAEEIVQASGLPWTILRATQFHGFVLRILQTLGIDTLPEVPVPAGMRFQSVDVGEVAGRLVELAEMEPSRRVYELAGPEVLSIEEMARQYLRTRQGSAKIRVELLGGFYEVFRSGVNLCPTGELGKTTWAAFLSSAFLNSTTPTAS